MPNRFADIGRSNLRAVGSNLVEKALDIRRRETQDKIDILNTGMAVSRFNTEQAAAERRRKMEDIAIQNAEAEQAALDRQTDITVNPVFLALPESVRGQVMKWGAQGGFWDENGVGSVRSQIEALKTVETSQQLSEAFFKPVVESKKNAVVEAWDAVVKAKETGDEEKVAKATAIYSKARVEYEASRDNLSKHLDSLGQQNGEILGTTMQKFSAGPQVAQELGIKVGDPYYTFADKTGNPLQGAEKLTEAQHETKKESDGDVGKNLEKLKSYRLALARLDSGQDIGTDLVAQISPELQSLLSTGNSKDVELAKQQLRLGIKYYEQQVPEQYRVKEEEPTEEKPTPEGPTVLGEGDISNTGSVTVPAPPLDLPAGSTFIRYDTNDPNVEYWTNPDDPSKAIKVTR